MLNSIYSMEKSMLSFVFMDESGKKESDRYFVCGFLQIIDNIKFSQLFQRVTDQIKNLSIRNRQLRVDDLLIKNNINELYNLARSYNEFELKHYHISNENQVLYGDLLKILFKKTEFRFTAIVFDRKDINYIRPEDEYDALYLKALKLYTTKCVNNLDYVFVPDSFNINFQWNVKSGNLPKAILPLDSKSCLQLQIVDILTGLIAQGIRMNNENELVTGKDESRRPVLDILENILNKKIRGNLTVNKPNYFSVWMVDYEKTKNQGMDKKPNPGFQQL